MSRWIRVGLNREVLREHMARENRSALTDAEIDQWLKDAGFRLCGDGRWIVRESDLGHLHPSEVTTIDIVDVDDSEPNPLRVKPDLNIF